MSIVPASGMLLEALSVGCQIISGMYVDNQKLMYDSFKKAGIIYDCKYFEIESIKKVLNQDLTVRYIAYNQLIDGFSKDRIIRLFKDWELKLRSAKKEDCLLIFDWANDSEVRRNGFNSEKIKWDNHQKWYYNKIENSKTKMFILEKNNIPVGHMRFDYENNYWLLDYSIDKNYRGLGLGTTIVNYGVTKIKGEIRAVVKAENISSCKVFERNKFTIVTSDQSLIQYRLIT